MLTGNYIYLINFIFLSGYPVNTGGAERRLQDAKEFLNRKSYITIK